MANQVQLWAPRPDMVYCAASGTPYTAGGDCSVLVWDYDVASVLPYGFSYTNPNPPPPVVGTPKAKRKAATTDDTAPSTDTPADPPAASPPGV